MAAVNRIEAAYRAACVRIAKELRRHPKRSAFKRDPDYAAVVGNDRRKRDVTEAFLRHLQQRHDLSTLARRVAANDRIGKPVLHTIDRYDWSAGSLRHLQVAEEIGNVPAVIEVGGGYGGQRLLCAGIADYTIVDIPEALAVQRAYLGYHQVPTTFVEAGGHVDVRPGSFLLSDFALSELPDDAIERYMETVVAKCARGRITCGRSTRDAMVKRLVSCFGDSVEFEPEQPRTSRHDNAVIRWRSVTSWPADPDAVYVETRVIDDTRRLMAERLASSEPWAFSRWGDGEWSAILGLGTANCDGQAYAPVREPLGQVLRDRPSYLLGMQPLAQERFGGQITRWLRTHAPGLTWVHADVFHDLSKWGELKEFVAPLRQRKVLLVGPAYLRALASILPYEGFVEVPERNAVVDLDRLRAVLSSVMPGTVVALSAGMVSKLLIHEFHSLPGTTWIDFGSVWDPYVEKQTRRYHAEIVAREGRCASS